MEIKVGEYARTECGIAKIKEISIKNEVFELDKDIMYIHQENYLHTCTKSQILKHSFNITDLIEEGDIVNGQRVLYIEKEGLVIEMADYIFPYISIKEIKIEEILIQKIRADLSVLDNALKKRLENKASKAEVTRIRIKTEESFNKLKNYYK